VDDTGQTIRSTQQRASRPSAYPAAAAGGVAGKRWVPEAIDADWTVRAAVSSNAGTATKDRAQAVGEARRANAGPRGRSPRSGGTGLCVRRNRPSGIAAHSTAGV